MIDQETLGKLFHGLRAAVTVADEDGRIIFLNDLAAEHYGDRGGESLLGTDLFDCHNSESQTKIKELYARYRAGDLTPTRYRDEDEDGLADGIILIPLVVDGRFRGIAELMWKERPGLVIET
jgi:PAS domain S-box-containing protein